MSISYPHDIQDELDAAMLRLQSGKTREERARALADMAEIKRRHRATMEHLDAERLARCRLQH